MKKLYTLIFLIIFVNHSAFAEQIALGKKLPDLLITDGGEFLFNADGEREYQPWSTASLKNKTRIIQYMPGRLTSRENLRLNDAVYKIDHPYRCRTISIVNYTDAIPGTWLFIEPELGRSKKRTPLCVIALDKSGIGLTRWNLEPTKNATIVVNEQGIVEFFYSGKLSDKQVEMIVSMTNPPGIKAPEPVSKNKQNTLFRN